MSYVSRLPLIIDRLVDEATEVADVDQVRDGPVLDEVLDNFLLIGLTQSASQPGYGSEISRQEGLGRPRLVEEFTVRCLLSVSDGETGPAAMRALRARCGATLSALDRHLRDLGPLAGVWDRCGMTGDTQWVPLQSEDGAIINVSFQIVGSALL